MTREAAAQGLAEAQLQPGDLSRTGRELGEHLTLAHAWWGTASAQGDAGAAVRPPQIVREPYRISAAEVRWPEIARTLGISATPDARINQGEQVPPNEPSAPESGFSLLSIRIKSRFSMTKTPIRTAGAILSPKGFTLSNAFAAVLATAAAPPAISTFCCPDAPP